MACTPFLVFPHVYKDSRLSETKKKKIPPTLSLTAFLHPYCILRPFPLHSTFPLLLSVCAFLPFSFYIACAPLRNIYYCLSFVHPSFYCYLCVHSLHICAFFVQSVSSLRIPLYLVHKCAHCFYVPPLVSLSLFPILTPSLTTRRLLHLLASPSLSYFIL